MREIRQSGSEGGEAGNLTGLPYPYQRFAARIHSLRASKGVGSHAERGNQASNPDP